MSKAVFPTSGPTGSTCGTCTATILRARSRRFSRRSGS
jgi:hypothetical protein